MANRMAVLFVALLLGCFDEPPSTEAQAGTSSGLDESSSAATAMVEVFDACVEVLNAAARADCPQDGETCVEGDGQPDAAWCLDTCSSRTEGQLVDACNALVSVGDFVARDAIDGCLAEIADVDGSCYLVADGGVCSGWTMPGGACASACDALGIFEACMQSDMCSCYACGGEGCERGTGTG